MARLLNYLLQHARDKLIKDEKIITDVFEQYGLRCSQQRLWQAVRALREVLSKCGFKREFILRVKSLGFTLSEDKVVVLFFHTPPDNQ